MKQKRFHLMGMGGAGMSAIAAYLLEQGHEVTGCDSTPSFVLERLKEKGALFHIGHDASHLKQADIFIYSRALSENEPERFKAGQSGLSLYSRSEFLNELTRTSKGISIAGSHGKSTTAAMIAMLFIHSGLDPSVVIGADLLDLKGNARFGKGDYFIYEADESDGSFSKYTPKYFVLNNLDDDHVDYYKSYEKLLEMFQNYLKKNLNQQKVFYCKDDPVLRNWENILESSVSFGTDLRADVRAENIRFSSGKTFFELNFLNSKLGEIELNLPGKHNVLNALAAIAVAMECGIDFELCRKTFKLFTGVYRRFQFKGFQNEITVIDDYAHHPTEITATLETAQQLTRGKLFCVFQPHRFTRTRDLGPLFPKALSMADEVILTEIYPASESPINGINGEWVFQESQNAGYKHFSYEPDLKKIPDRLLSRAQKGDCVLTVGAGNVNEVAEALVKKLEENAANN